ncbi:type II CAAX endopeptidase family protein [Pontibacter cellulosilyticus]|uniref:CPBP family intramembrane metalloprotease n=1 Tax=Pontibacter cellulosilyticus TaxID=1720253 RepID=A0A923SNI1_9BACT|nr:type II CAAX endopeptidase family protein [Pontibacter cellulosilyticus]MBC5993220.1 CPBP family intramembrane metalloprotease [Pontibacter cellulosilyticus]
MGKASLQYTELASIWGFFGLSFLFSWAVWGAMLALSLPADLMLPLLILGAFGPTFAAVYLMHRYGNAANIRDFWTRVISFKKIGWEWYLVILSIFPAIYLLGYYIYSYFGGEQPPVASLFSGLDSFSAILLFAFVMIFAGPVSEELGWRGYVLDPLQQKYGSAGGSLILGIFWILWHLPLFFIEGTSQHAKGFGYQFWSWSFQLIMLSFVFTWIYNNTNRSILGAILLHLMANLAYPTNLEPTGELIFTAIRVLVVLAIVWAWKQKSVIRQDLAAA